MCQYKLICTRAIAREKGGIFKEEVPAFVIKQPEEPLEALRECAKQAGSPFMEIPPLAAGDASPGIAGRHQLANAGLAVALCSAFCRRAPPPAMRPAIEPLRLPVLARYVPSVT